MKIALAQIAVSGDKPANLENIAKSAASAGAEGARLVVFPEASMHHFGK
ncbi:MAG: hypothetical protein JO349_07300, partial [Candidatus Eremiobacteraeota bacterium]|nr:hypothetical protein [Candidatus Eremiobacteraeota bacterium]